MAYPVVDMRKSLPHHPRREWKIRKLKKIKQIVVHTTASSNQDPRRTARYHITPGPENHLSRKGAPAIAYHDFIQDDGNIVRCNDYEYKTWHAGFWANRKSVGVAMAFPGHRGESPSLAQYRALLQHLTDLCLFFWIPPHQVIGHREVRGVRKSCPGEAVNLNRMRHSLTLYLQKRLRKVNLYVGKIDGIWGPLSQQALTTYIHPGRS